MFGGKPHHICTPVTLVLVLYFSVTINCTICPDRRDQKFTSWPSPWLLMGSLWSASGSCCMWLSDLSTCLLKRCFVMRWRKSRLLSGTASSTSCQDIFTATLMSVRKLRSQTNGLISLAWEVIQLSTLTSCGGTAQPLVNDFSHKFVYFSHTNICVLKTVSLEPNTYICINQGFIISILKYRRLPKHIAGCPISVGWYLKISCLLLHIIFSTMVWKTPLKKKTNTWSIELNLHSLPVGDGLPAFYWCLPALHIQKEAGDDSAWHCRAAENTTLVSNLT